jgi:hypothetical protein
MKLYSIESKFTTSEFTCPCNCGFGDIEKDISKPLVDKLNMMRLLYGKPMVVTSGARCQTYNDEIGGLPNSAHLRHVFTNQCRAVDILVTASEDRYNLVRIAQNVGIERIGLGPNFLHFDVAWDLSQPVMFNY